MFFRTALFILCLPALLATADVEIYSQGAAPSWVKVCDFSLDDVPVKSSQVNWQRLLIDTQRNWEEKTQHEHYVFKVLSKWGAEDVAQLEIVFAPSYQRVIVHDARVFRDGEWSDRLSSARLKVLQKEEGSGRGIFSGNLTLVYFLDDIREGDVVEYAFSRIGEPPLTDSKLVGTLYLQYHDSVEKIHYRVLGRPDLPLQIKSFNTSIEPRVSDLSPLVREWVWEAAETHPSAPEDNEPDWYDSSARVELSLFENWGEVAKQTCPLYALAADFAESIPSEMRALIEEWKGSAKNKSELALMAVRFVQDEVRYLSLGEGLMGWKPAHPSITFQQRFGDCKDKSFLLHALLKLMDIPSTVVLVNATVGKGVAERLPTPYFANHAVLQLEVDGTLYWVDSTLSLQGGSLETNYFPDYAWGLLISDKTEGLTALPQEVRKNPSEIESSYVLVSEDAAHLNTKVACYGPRADAMRRILKAKGLKAFAKAHLANMQNVYGWVGEEAPVKVLDDRENNVLRLMFSYSLSTEGASNSKFIEVYSYILSDYLTRRVNPVRSSPYEIDYPFWVKERIHIENPFMDLEPMEEEFAQKNASLFYALKTRENGKSADYDIELKHLQDHIPPQTFRDHWNMVKDIYRNAPGEIRIDLPAEMMDD